MPSTNQAKMIAAYKKARPVMDVHDAAETAEDHGIRPEDLKSRTSGKRKRRTKKPVAEFAYRYRGE